MADIVSFFRIKKINWSAHELSILDARQIFLFKELYENYPRFCSITDISIPLKLMNTAHILSPILYLFSGLFDLKSFILCVYILVDYFSYLTVCLKFKITFRNAIFNFQYSTQA